MKSFIISLFILVSLSFATYQDLVLDFNKMTDENIYLTGYDNGFNTLHSMANYPELSASVKKYKGIPKNDSVKIFLYTIDNNQFQIDRYKEGKYDVQKFTDEFQNNQNIFSDFLSNYSHTKKVDNYTYVAVGFHKKKQFIIGDLNRNKDFSDDVLYQYDMAIRKNPLEKIESIKAQPTANFTYEIFEAKTKEINTYARKIKFFPRNIGHRRSLADNEYGYSVEMKYVDYWQTEVDIYNKKYKIYMQGWSPKDGSLYIVPAKYNLSDKNIEYNLQFSVSFGAEQKIGKKRFMIDSINKDFSKIYFKDVTSLSANNYGHKPGDEIMNYQIRDVQKNGNFIKIHDLLKEKKYTLIDFLSTTCGPCIASVPTMKKLINEHITELTILSIANDNDPEKVIGVINKTKMNWYNGIMKEDFDKNLMTDLKVNFLPTSFLIDKNGEIIYRGSNIDELEKLIQ